MRVGDLIVLKDRSYQVDKVIYSREDEETYYLRVTDHNTKRPFRLKIVYGQDESLLMGKREAERLITLDLPLLPRIHAVDVDEEKFSLLMESVEGRTLRSRINELKGDEVHRLDANLSLCINLCMAIEDIHKADYYHSDLKPDNIVIVEESADAYTFKFVDIGLSRLIYRLSGISQYWAPEQIVNQSTGALTDIFSLALICMEILTGELPAKFSYPDGADWVKFERPSEIVPDFPEQLESVLLKAAAYQKADRFSTVGEFRAELQRVQKLRLDCIKEQVHELEGTELEVPVVPGEKQILDPEDAAAANDIILIDTASSDLSLEPVYATPSSHLFGLYFLILFGIFLGALIIWDMYTTVEQPQPAQAEKLDMPKEPIVVITPVSSAATPNNPDSPAPLRKQVEVHAEPAPTVSIVESVPKNQDIRTEEIAPQVVAAVPALTIESDGSGLLVEFADEEFSEQSEPQEWEPEPEPEVEPDPEPLPVPVPIAVAAETHLRELEKCRADVLQCQLALKKERDNPERYLDLATATYGLGVLEQDAAMLMNAKDYYAQALEYGAKLPVCELAFRLIELSIAVMDSENNGVVETATELARIHKTLVKAEPRVMSDTSLYRDWVFLVKLSTAYQCTVGGDYAPVGVDNTTDTVLTSCQQAFLDQCAGTNECLPPTSDVLSFLQL